ncbi:AraC family transcriptional regulator ligand-binding domain-containing protein [Bacterioplanoides sp.]|uniref:AraC family transcriptional regulator n=1 Tax=Bacterioplanoides sp. TaxID=2066072 RepID=UPI003B5AAF7C
MQTQFQVSGDLAGLVRQYLQQQQDCDWFLYQELETIAANNRITFERWWHILEALQARYPDKNIALELGANVRPVHLGVLGYLVLACNTMAEALLEFQRYQGLLHDGDRAQASSDGNLMMLSWSRHYQLNHVLSDQVLISGMVSFIRTMVGQPELKASRLCFSFPRPDWPDEVYQPLCEEVLFDQPATAICFPPEYLNLPVANSDPDLKALLEQQAQAMLAILPQQDDLIIHLRAALLKALRKGQATSEFVASELHMSERTLFRRLQQYDFTFKQILAQTRTELAKEQLKSGQLTLAEIALLLGYSEQSAFNRAFKRETGMTPRQYQQND